MSSGGRYFVDTNIIIRYLTNDDPDKANRVESFLKASVAGELRLVTNLMVIAELVWTLESYYELSKPEIAEKLLSILNTPNLEVQGKRTILRALSVYEEKNIDFADAYNAIFMHENEISTILTYNKKHFGRIPWLKRIEP